MKIFAERGRLVGDEYKVQIEMRKDDITSSLTRNPQLNMLLESPKFKSEYKEKEVEIVSNGLTVNDLFCGAGGMGRGFVQAGFKVNYAIDFDKYAVQSYNTNMEHKAVQGDITQLKGIDVPYADVWTFGFPCQDLSVAGKQAGMIKGQTRSGLFYEVMRLLEETEHKPKIILAENVKGLKKYLPALREEYLKAGYIMYETLFNSKYWGVPQNRERYFVMGIGQRLFMELWKENPHFSPFPEQQTDFVPKLSSILEDNVDEKFYIDNGKARKVIEQARQRVELKGTHATITPDRVDKRQNGRRSKDDEEEMYTLTSQDHHGLIQVGKLDMKGHDVIRRVYDPNGLSPTLTTSEGGHRQPKILTPISVSDQATKFVKESNISHTLLARDYKGFGNQEMNAVVDGFRVRKLTPREYARLQGFEDSFEFVVSNTQLYKQFGNAVTVPVAKAIAEKIKEVLS